MSRISILYSAAAAVAVLVASGMVPLAHVPAAFAASSKGGTGRQAPLDESKMTCKQISGRIQLLILRLRGYDSRKQASGLSRGLQSAASTVGATATGSDPAGQHSTEIGRLHDYNQRLASMGCKSYNIDAELRVTDPHQSPAATVPPPKKAKATDR